MRTRTINWIERASVVFALALTLVAMPSAAQPPPGQLTTIDDKLDEVLSTLNGIPGVLVTPEITRFDKGVSCSVTNAGAVTAAAEIALLDGAGNTVYVESNVPIAPGAAQSVRAAAGALPGQIHCRVTATQGDKRDLRVVLCAHEGASTLNSACIAAVEGR